jgi:hypothetical protein
LTKPAYHLQGTNCNVLLHNALYQWLGERVELSLSEEDNPEEAAKARESVLNKIQNEDMVSEFLVDLASTCSNTQALVEVRIYCNARSGVQAYRLTHDLYADSSRARKAVTVV